MLKYDKETGYYILIQDGQSDADYAQEAYERGYAGTEIDEFNASSPESAAEAARQHKEGMDRLNEEEGII